MLHSYALIAKGDWTDLIGVAIFLIVVVGGWIANLVKQVRASQEKRQRELDRQLAGEERPVNPQDESESVREQMRRVAQQGSSSQTARRPSAAGASGGTPGQSPNALTMAQRIERARAGQVQQDRAAAVHRDQQQRQALTNRQETSRRAKAEAEQRRQEATQRAVKAQKQRHTDEKATLRRQDAARRAEMDGPIDTRTPQTSHAGQAQPAPQAATASRQAVAVPRARGIGGVLLGYPLRDAMILKEILGPPLALRDQQDQA